MGRRNEHSKEELKQRLLQAAEAIIAEEGLGGLNARRLASDVGYVAGSIYLVFENLDDLVLQVNARTLDALGEELRRALDQAGAPGDGMRALGRRYAAFALERGESWRAVFEHRLPAGRPIPDWYREKVSGLFELARRALTETQTAEPGQALAAHALWAGIHGICVLAVTGKLEATGGYTVAEMVESLLDNFLGGFLDRS